MKRLKDEQLRAVALACGLLLMMGWFTLTAARLHQEQVSGEAADRRRDPGGVERAGADVPPFIAGSGHDRTISG